LAPSDTGELLQAQLAAWDAEARRKEMLDSLAEINRKAEEKIAAVEAKAAEELSQQRAALAKRQAELDQRDHVVRAAAAVANLSDAPPHFEMSPPRMLHEMDHREWQEFKRNYHSMQQRGLLPQQR
jgi:hypothetical protein